ncbi:MAG: TolC family protein [Flammeovirgaceae bacterium]
MKKSFFTILIALLSTNSFAQEIWSLKKCISYALEQNIQIKLNEIDVKNNEVILQQSENNRLPSLNGQITHNYNWGRSFDVFTNTPIIDRVQSNNFGIFGSVTLFNGFQLKNTILQNQVNLEVSKLAVEQQKNDIALLVANAYLQILFNKELLESSKISLQSIQERISLLEKQIQGGTQPASSIYDLHSQKATTELQIITRENTLATAYLRLKQLLQLPENSNFEIEYPTLPEPTENLVLPTTDEIFKQAEALQPSIKRADKAIESSQIGERIAKAGFMPTLTLSAGLSSLYSSSQDKRVVGRIPNTDLPPTTETIGYFFQNGERVNVLSDFYENKLIVENVSFFKQLDEGFNKRIGLTLNIPIFNRFQTNSNIYSARIIQERNKLNAQSARVTLRQNIEQAYIDLVAASKSYYATKNQVKVLEEQVKVNKQRMDLGVGNITEYRLAENNLLTAKFDLSRAKFDFLFKSKILDFYMGKNIDF